jgi:hypothetical protein
LRELWLHLHYENILPSNHYYPMQTPPSHIRDDVDGLRFVYRDFDMDSLEITLKQNC